MQNPVDTQARVFVGQSIVPSRFNAPSLYFANRVNPGTVIPAVAFSNQAYANAPQNTTVTMQNITSLRSVPGVQLQAGQIILRGAPSIIPPGAAVIGTGGL